MTELYAYRHKNISCDKFSWVSQPRKYFNNENFPNYAWDARWRKNGGSDTVWPCFSSHSSGVPRVREEIRSRTENASRCTVEVPSHCTYLLQSAMLCA